VRKHPLIVAFACDVPYDTKRKLINNLQKTLPNFFIEIPYDKTNSSPTTTSSSSSSLIGEDMVTNITPATNTHTTLLPQEMNMGINIVEIQKALKQNKSVILTVDHGLTQITRANFIKNFNMVWRSLPHEPLTIFLQGDELNQRTPIHDPRYGVYHRDIELMRDYRIKYGLEKLSYLTKRFLQQHIKRRMATLYSSPGYPSYAFVIVLEALYIVQQQAGATHNNNHHTNNGTNSHNNGSGGKSHSSCSSHTNGEMRESYNIPELKMTKLSYNRSKILLMDPYLLYHRLLTLKRGQSSYYLCQIIRYYLQHPYWPTQPHHERKEDELLHLLASYLEEWNNCEILTYQKGGLPSSSMSDLKIQIENCISVITITDAIASLKAMTTTDPEYGTGPGSGSNLVEDTLLSVKKSGWMTPMAYLYKSVFHEVRVYHTVKKIDSETSDLYQINVYRHDQHIFFDAYNPKTSQCYYTSITIDEVPSLLVPSVLVIKNGKLTSTLSVASPHGGGGDIVTSTQSTLPPPLTSKELYQRLVDLLQVRHLIKLRNSKKELVCHRKNIFIKRYSLKICGHNVMLNCYESGMSELFFQAYLPEYSATLLYHLNDQERLKMLANCDHLLEYHLLDSTNSLDILPYVVDRLRILPNKAMKACMSRTSEENNYLGEPMSPLVYALKRTALHQGYRLVLHSKSGAGKYLIRKIISFFNIPHILTLKSSSITQTLRVILYNPLTQTSQEIRIDAFLRHLLLRNATDNYKLWIDILIQKLRLNYQHQRELVLDMMIYRKLHTVSSAPVTIPTTSRPSSRASRPSSRPSSSVEIQAPLSPSSSVPPSPSSSSSPSFLAVSPSLTKERFIFTVYAVNEMEIRVTLFHPQSCELFESHLQKENVLNLLLFTASTELQELRLLLTPLEFEHRAKALCFLQTRRDHYQTFEETKVKVLMTHTLKELSFSEIPFQEILCHLPCLQYLTKQLSLLLQRDAATNNYFCHLSGIKLEFTRVVVEEVVEEKADDVFSIVTRALSRSSSTRPPTATATWPTPPTSRGGVGTENSVVTNTEEMSQVDTDDKSGFDMSFRYRQRLNPKVHSNSGTVDEVLSRRRQAPVVFLEKYLEELAESKIEIAKQRILSDLAAAETLATSCYGCSGDKDDDQDAMSLNDSFGSEHSSADSDDDQSSVESHDQDQPPQQKIEVAEDLKEPPELPITRREVDEDGLISADPEADSDSINPQNTQEEKEAVLDPNPDEGHQGSVGSQLTNDKSSQNHLEDRSTIQPPPIEKPNVELLTSMRVVEDIITALETKEELRLIERSAPGTRQEQYFEKKQLEKLEMERQKILKEGEGEEVHLREIIIRKEVFVFERKLRVNYRDGRSRWGATAKVGIYESACWDGPEGVGRKIRFVVHDTKTNGDYEGLIRGTSHLRQILGPHGEDLIPIPKTTEMILFLCRHRLEVVRNMITTADAPIYRIEFIIPEVRGKRDGELSEAEKKKKREEEEQVAQSKFFFFFFTPLISSLSLCLCLSQSMPEEGKLFGSLAVSTVCFYSLSSLNFQ
jgi:hypothetical protein